MVPVLGRVPPFSDSCVFIWEWSCYAIDQAMIQGWRGLSVTTVRVYRTSSHFDRFDPSDSTQRVIRAGDLKEGQS